MTVADLFVKIGIAGAEGVGKSLSSVQKSMSGLLDTSLAVKAGILGIVVGLERLTGFASQVGMDLNKFTMSTGLSAQQLQNWQYMAGKFDVSGQEMSQTIVGLQDKISDMKLGKGMPEGAALLGIKMTDDPFDLMRQLTAATKKFSPAITRNVMKSFGISDNMFQMMRSVDLVKDRISKKNIISNEEIKRLTEINKAWKDMWFGLKTMGIKFIAQDGIYAVKELANAFRLFEEAGKWLLSLNDKFAAFKVLLIGMTVLIAIMFSPITAAVAAATALIAIFSDIQKFREGKDSLTGEFVSGAKATKDNIMHDLSGAKDWAMSLVGQKKPEDHSAFGGATPQFASANAAPIQSSRSSTGNTSTVINNNQKAETHIHAEPHPHDTAKLVQRANQKTFNEMPNKARAN